MTAETPAQQAGRRARRLYPKSRGFQNAYMAGWRAALNGRPSSACPYPADAGGTWRKAWRLAWLRGHGSYVPDEPEIG